MKYLIGLIALALSACATHQVNTSHVTVEPGMTVTMGGQKMELYPNHALKKNGKFPEVSLKNEGLEDQILKADGVVKLISVIPSIDTRVCDIQTHELGETRKLDPSVRRITISMDLPFAQTRFKKAAHLDNILYLSDFDGQRFGQATGTLIPCMGILTRALFVVDGAGVLRYYQIVPEIGEKPDMNRAIAEANRLAIQSSERNLNR